MSFLDNLENTLKSLENQKEDAQEEKNRRKREEAQREHMKSAQPYADELRSGKFTQELLSHVTRLGHARRMAVRPMWLGSTLRLEAQGRKLDLEPTPEGVLATARVGETEMWKSRVDISLQGTAEKIAARWLG